MIDTQNNKPSKASRSVKYKIAGTIGGTSLLIAALFGGQAIAESKAYQHAQLYLASDSDDSAKVYKTGWKKERGERKRFSEMSEAELESKITRAVKHASIEIEASPEQEEKIIALALALAKDMKPLHGEFKAAGEEMKTLLTAETVDRVAMEKVRSERIAEADRLSKEVMTAAADVADVLSPEQRKVVAERLEEFKSMRGRWHRGKHHKRG